MTDEINEVPKVDFLAQVRAEREAMEKVRNESQTLLAELKEIRAREILGGRTDGGIQEPEKKLETPKEYAQRMLRGG